jgi:DNA-binding MarR family transcriptional regulator
LDINVSNDQHGGPLGEPGSVPERLCHELFELSAAVDVIGRAAADRLGINQTDLICLNLLAQRGPMGAGQVAAALGLTTAAISAMAARLEAGGYARREIDPKDRRRVLLHPSEDGMRTAFGLFDGLYQAAVELHAGYGERDARLLVELLGRYRELLAEQAAGLAEGSP